MEPSNRNQVEELFRRIVSLPPDEQAAYLDEHCDDPAARDDVRKLLESRLKQQGSRTADVLPAAPTDAVKRSAPGRGDLPRRSPNDSSGAAIDHGRFLPGTVLAERYRIVALLGRGGMGEVYRADDLELGQSVALKFLPERLAKDQSALARFRGEVRLARQVSHPNVCRVYDIGHVDELYFLSMEYVDGEDLGLLLRRIGRFPRDRAAQIARELCFGLAAAHEKGVLHRDLKPANVMVDGRGKLLITDFGLADFAQDVPADDVRSGTPAYMAPEQLAGREVSAQSDIYSLGLVLHEVFTGKPVWEADTLAELFDKRRYSSAPTPSAHEVDLDPVVERVIQRCLEADPRNRPSSAVSVAAALPGGDPLAAALAAGETPSPDMVAAAGEQEGLRPALALASLVLLTAGLIVMMFLAERVTPFPVGAMESPDVLERDARDILTHLQYFDSEAYRDYGFGGARAGDGRSSGAFFWYRQSPEPLVPGVTGGMFLHSARISETNPAPLTPGMAGLRLELDGRLIEFHAVPPEARDPGRESTRTPAEWKSLASSVVGMDLEEFVETQPRTHPRYHAATVLAWRKEAPGAEGSVTRQVEVGTLEGRVVYVNVLDLSVDDIPARFETEIASGWIWAFWLWPLFLLAAVLVPRNLHRGRGDRRGAFRLACFAFAIRLFLWYTVSSHVPHSSEFRLWANGVAWASFTAFYFWGLYIALEPFLRRLWPELLISWTRLLAGRVRDPVLGRDLLLGMLCGVAVLTLNRMLQIWWGEVFPLGEYQLLTLLGGRATFFAPPAAAWYATLNAVLNCLLFVVLRVLSRKVATTVIVFLVLRAAMILFLQDGPAVSALLWPPLEAFVLLRFGLVGLLGVFVVRFPFLFCVFTTDLSLSYAGSGMLALAFLFALAAFCCFTSLRGRPVFREVEG